ncbi:DUF3727 domain-containing protein [Myxosarcina sp. GI1]|uniref:DUF3727 domain-containing protein n=1 Tax=Myxosarcina sp. GI1 TaxID=1541065 RepID=UPI00055C3450|nr:DUF3727 domain-containing protein [Myxosarcina sp. GI1]
MSSSQFNRDNEYYDGETLTLVDDNGRSLPCYIEHSIEVDGITYLLLMPTDIPIVIMSWEREDDENEEVEATMLEDDSEIAEIFGNAKAVLAEQNLYLYHTAYTLTAIGELPPLEEDEILTLNIDDEDSQLEPEELQLLASFYHSERKYCIYTPLTPLLFFARYDLENRLELVSPEQENLLPILQELLFDESE